MLSGNGTIDYDIETHTLDVYKTSAARKASTTRNLHLYFGSCDLVGAMCHSECSFHVIMFGGPLGDALSFGDLCSVYKAGCCQSSDLWKKQVSLRHREPGPHDRISVTIYLYIRLMI